MATLTVVNESKTAKNTDVLTMSQAIKVFVSQVCAAWGIPAPTVVYGITRGTGWNICIVDNFPNPAMTNIAYGYHEVVNGQPIGYVRANSFGNRSPFGTYVKPLVIAGRQITKPIYTPGISAVAMHEVAEMLIDPNINRYATDPQGRQWLMEICDHTTGNYNIPLTSYNANVIAPDFTFPAFYEIGAKGPYSYLEVPTKPFTLPSGAYGYYKAANGTVTPLTAETIALDKA